MVLPDSLIPITGRGRAGERPEDDAVDPLLCGRDVVFRTGFFPPLPG